MVPILTERCQNAPMGTVGERLREAREAKGMSVRALARVAGGPRGDLLARRQDLDTPRKQAWKGDLGHANLLRIESGQQPKPGAEKLSSYATALGVSVDWLLTGEGPRERPSAERTVEIDDPYPERADAIARMRGAVSEEAIAAVREVQNLGHLTVQEWVDELLHADRRAQRGTRVAGRPLGEGEPAGRTGSKITARRR